jgi:1-acyl-sn-glycerol-3-phosphate acyltransferase
MQNIVIDKPYVPVPPYRGRWWPKVLSPTVAWFLNRKFGITRTDIVGQEHLQASLDAGHGILLTPNHVRDCDPVVVGMLCPTMKIAIYLMASWHVFHGGRVLSYILRRAGGFSIYREGLDRGAVNTAIDILENAERPLVIFPEGVVSRANDRLNALMDGTALIARTAAKRREKQTPAGKVVVHPIGIRYYFHGHLAGALEPVLDEIESRLTWRVQRGRSLAERINKVGAGLLALKEIEYFGQPQSGTVGERIARLIDRVLGPVEAEWAEGKNDGTVVTRVKRIRTAILPDLVKGDITEDERRRRWGQLADVYLAQQLSNYPPDYIRSNPTPERLLETVERFEEDLTDKARIHRPMTARLTIGPAIEVPTGRERGGNGGDPLMQKIESELRRLLQIPDPAAAAAGTAETPPVAEPAAQP